MYPSIPYVGDAVYWKSMLGLQEKLVFRRFLYSKITISVLIGALFFALTAVWDVYGKYREAARNRDVASVEYEAAQMQVAALKKEVELLKTDRGVEKTIREEFGFAREGEGAIILVEDASPQNTKTPLHKENLLGSMWESIKTVF